MPDELSPAEQPPFVHQVRPRIVVKYRDSIPVPVEPSDGLDGSLLTPGWKDFRLQFPGLRNRRLLRPPIDTIRRIGQRAGERDTRLAARKLENYVVLDVPEGMSAEDVRDFARQDRLRGAVEFAYVTPPPVPPPSSYPANTAEGALQPYLEKATTGGLDARYAWDHPGGDGRDQSLYDVEWGWALDHQDLPTTPADLLGGNSYSYFHHGTAVLGVVAAKRDAAGCIGIAHGVKRVRCASSWRNSAGTEFDIAEAIWDVITAVVTEGVTGAVLLLEEQTSFYGRNNVPAESIPAVFEMVRLATTLGITVVAAAGNGGNDLDTFTDDFGNAFLDPDSPDYADSGAILVAAASSALPHARLAVSNHGKRVNCFAWGDRVYSPSTNAYATDRQGYGYVLANTSSATAMIAGAALVTQGLAAAARGATLAPVALPTILAGEPRGPRSAGCPGDGIGVMPDLRRIIDDGILLAASPT